MMTHRLRTDPLHRDNLARKRWLKDADDMNDDESSGTPTSETHLFYINDGKEDEFVV